MPILNAPGLLVALAVLALLIHGPIPQLADYHAFAAQAPWLGLPHGADVWSNLGFGMVGVWGWRRLGQTVPRPGQAGYQLFAASLVLTALGSSWYHLAPDDARLVWDRLPIALACAGLLYGSWADTCLPLGWRGPALAGLGLAAVASVGWWASQGDLRPYLLLQGLPLVLIPLWQWQHPSPSPERQGFGVAILLYLMAKGAELRDHALLALTHGLLSGHTLKHLLATAAALLILASITRPAAAPWPRRR